MESSITYEIFGFVVFAQPFRTTETGEAIVARFNFRCSAINVTGALLIKSVKEYRVVLTSRRNQRVFFVSHAARQVLTRLAVAQLQDEKRIGAHGAALKKVAVDRPLAKAPSQMPAQPDGV